MAIKIKHLSLNGIRGVKGKLMLPLNQKSILLYGDNGTGKSSISDSIEWFFTDCVSHLSSSEIDMKEAIRNANLDENDASTAKLSFSSSGLDCEKQMIKKKDKFICEFSNTAPEFKTYLSDSEKENLILRHQYLRDFVDQTKGDKLKYLSDIIGFTEVTKVKDVLKKNCNSLKTELKAQNFESLISTQKQTLVSKIGAAVSREEDLYEQINHLIDKSDTGIEVKSITDIDRVLNKLKNPINTNAVKTLAFLENCKSTLTSLKNEINFINQEYKKYYTEFEIIANDVASIMQTFLEDLLKSGNTVLVKKYHKEASCPLCLQPKNHDDLKKEIATRLSEIAESSKKYTSFENAKQSVATLIAERLKRLALLSMQPLIEAIANLDVKNAIYTLNEKLAQYQVASSEKVTSGKGIKKPDQLSLADADFLVLQNLSNRIEEIKKNLEGDNSTVLFSNISAAKDAFLNIKRFESTKAKLQEQKESLEFIYNEFVKKQKEGLQNFIDSFSDKVNEFYQYMNPGELFHEIRIATIGEEDELNGLTIQYKYLNSWVSPPQKYFSESHLNCFGISFFLASVIAFNKKNRFLVLDDVISSFDTNHRKRFADLLIEKFSDWQIILLTHDQEWFQYVSQVAKRNSWLINQIKWSESLGTCFEEKPMDLRILITNSIAESEIEFLGNPIRKYLEHILKEICANLDVKVGFRYNDVNEKRMPDELLTCLKAKVSKSSTELNTKITLIDRVANSSLLGNLLSHNNPFNPKIGDLKAFWLDILELENVFYCQDVSCKKPSVSIKNYDHVLKKIRCGCDMTKYDWKL